MNNRPQVETIQTDVLVAGSGGAGLRAAVGALEKGAKVLLASKGRLARSGASPMAGADLTCHGRGMRAVGFFGEPRDSEEKFLSDIVHQGSFLNNQRLTELYVKDGPERMREMLDWGMKVNFTDERAVFTPGPSIVDAVYRQARKLGVKTLEDVALLDLYKRDGRVIGALALNFKSGTFYRIQAKAVVLATGGWHKAFEVVTGSRELTGDGTAMAIRAGAELVDMEFITFACNTLFWPRAYRGSILLYVLGLVVGGELENSLGERIFEKYDPWMIAYANKTEWNKSIISIITACEIRDDRALLHGGVRFVPGEMGFEAFNQKAEAYCKDWIFHDGDFSGVRESLRRGEGAEVGPGAEYFEGGIAVNETYETSLPGLYAAGECAGSVFGANRVAAATMEMLTTGARAGWSAAKFAISSNEVEVNQSQEAELIEKALAPLIRKRGENVIKARKELQRQSQLKMGPVRAKKEILDYISFLENMKRDVVPKLGVQHDSLAYNKEWIESLDLINMVDTMKVCSRAALEREESRGVHYREDFPDVDNDTWLKQILASVKDDELVLRKRPVDTSLLDPPSGKSPYMEFIQRMMAAHTDVGGHH
jgi:succinate dehydrogenase/fumarate reductase flavoprotein subunit